MKMEIKLKGKWSQKRLSNILKPLKKPHTGITGIISENISGIPIQSIAYDQARLNLTHRAEFEIKKAQAFAEAHRLLLR
jgi:hypothetical protein